MAGTPALGPWAVGHLDDSNEYYAKTWNVWGGAAATLLAQRGGEGFYQFLQRRCAAILGD